jgi:mRNA interferase MazF
MAEPLITRGAVVGCVLAGDDGKPRPAVVVQADLFNASHASVTVCPLTSDCLPAPMFRIPVRPTKANGLHQLSDVMVDKVTSLRRERITGMMGRLSDKDWMNVEQALRLWLDLP